MRWRLGVGVNLGHVSCQDPQEEMEPASFSWTYEEIKEVHKRWWQLKDSGVEIFLTNGRTFLLAFDNTKASLCVICAVFVLTLLCVCVIRAVFNLHECVTVAVSILSRHSSVTLFTRTFSHPTCPTCWSMGTSWRSHTCGALARFLTLST